MNATTIAPTRPKVSGKPRHGNDGHDFDDVEHIVPEDDPNTALCGADQTDAPWNTGQPVCQACVIVARGGLN